MYTRHGHHIPGTILDSPAPKTRARCGGPSLCPSCALDYSKVSIDTIEKEVYDGTINYPYEARKIVVDYINKMATGNGSLDRIDISKVYVVWFCKTLQNWKGLISTTSLDDKYYEVTYSGERKETYLDVYIKAHNIVILGRYA